MVAQTVRALGRCKKLVSEALRRGGRPCETAVMHSLVHLYAGSDLKM